MVNPVARVSLAHVLPIDSRRSTDYAKLDHLALGGEGMNMAAMVRERHDVWRKVEDLVDAA